ncbi:NIPSNAP family protein [Bacillaceae bacterium S4-13-58]
MIYRRKTYRIIPEKLEVFNEFFHTFLYPNQMKHGAKLIGRWVNENKTEITAIWEYESMEQYESIEKQIRSSELHQKAKERRKELGELFLESSQDFLTSTAKTGSYSSPKLGGAVSD